MKAWSAWNRFAAPPTATPTMPPAAAPATSTATPAAPSPETSVRPKTFSVVVPDIPGYPHTEAFREASETVYYGLQALGYERSNDNPDLRILFGAHLLDEVPPGCIVYNLEQVGTQMFLDTTARVTPLMTVWDYSRSNIKEWSRRGVHAKFVPLGYTPEIDRITPDAEQNIDVLFYGSWNERRNHILAGLVDAGLSVHSAIGVYGPERDELIARSKVVLNMHHYVPPGIFEVARVFYLMANGVCVVSEDSVDCDEYFRGCAMAPYNRLVELCKYIVSSSRISFRLSLGSLARDVLKTFFDEREILKRVLP